jgi:hypothetical protein
MAVTKSILKNTHQEAVVKVAGTAASATIDLSSDLVNTGLALDGETQTVNIVGVMWSGASGGTVQIARNSVVVKTMVTDSADYHDFTGQDICPDTTENTSDIVVTISGAQAECWVKLRKVGGYKTTIEPEQFGPYDNPSVAGS